MFLCAQIASIVLLLVALDAQPYGYYQFLRIFVCCLSLYCAKTHRDLGQPGWSFSLLAIALIFNPLAPIHLTKDCWQYCNLLSAAIIFCSLYAARKKSLLGPCISASIVFLIALSSHNSTVTVSTANQPTPPTPIASSPESSSESATKTESVDESSIVAAPPAPPSTSTSAEPDEPPWALLAPPQTQLNVGIPARASSADSYEAVFEANNVSDGGLQASPQPVPNEDCNPENQLESAKDPVPTVEDGSPPTTSGEASHPVLEESVQEK